MASITIRKLDESTKQQLRLRAAHNQRSMEDEARNILRAALAGGATMPFDLGQMIHRRFVRLGGIELQLPAREAIRKAPEPGK
jgi:plasmid stability protein